MIKPPKHLSKESQAAWNDVLSRHRLERDGLMVLQQLLENWDLAQGALADVRREGRTVQGHKGAKVRHPCIDVANKAHSLFLAGVRTLGLEVTPTQIEQELDV